MIPGTFLSPRDVDIGDLVQAKDPGDIWYDAKIIAKHQGPPLKVTVRYVGFGKSHDETFGAVDKRVRVRLPTALLKQEARVVLPRHGEGPSDGGGVARGDVDREA